MSKYLICIFYVIFMPCILFQMFFSLFKITIKHIMMLTLNFFSNSKQVLDFPVNTLKRGHLNTKRIHQNLCLICLYKEKREDTLANVQWEDAHLSYFVL